MAEAKKSVFTVLKHFNSRIIGAYAKGDVFGGVYTDSKAKKAVDQLIDGGFIEEYKAPKATKTEK